MLIAEMFENLPARLSDELRLALTCLDCEQIDNVIGQIAEIDVALSQTLSSLTENYDYPAILNVLDQLS